MKHKTKTGLDLLLTSAKPDLKNKPIGLVCHPASINGGVKPITDVLQNLSIVKLFGPEHGIWGNAQDMVGVETTRDPHTQLPIVSLYGNTFESLKPKHEDLADIDLLIIDLQDIGTRYYTFIYTMAFCLEVCAKQKKKVIVLDRPNPINGLTLEGPLLQKGFESFVGVYPIPIRHGMTIGELALYFNEEFSLGCDLKIIPMQGWQRKMYFEDTGLPWVYPSPNMPTIDTALVYPGQCLIEATELSEGRGTTKPFELTGAPYINPWDLAEKLNALKLPGIIFRPTFFTPTFHKWAGLDCGGVFLHVTNRALFKPVLTTIQLIKTIHDLYPHDFKWREKPYEFVSDIPAIDLLWGGPQLREMIAGKLSLKKVCTSNETGWVKFLKKREKYLLY
ncbi:MAG: hypothetical protein ACD_73C00789G0001 [uncultured bacterium]|nr:MAG: hypothetical protein ACD_73C00789G0001 [uncultured bacterium]